ncbi:VOC family protein [Dietzia sp. 179-F 9C3 NHS]|uniref:VOC family protein n=1 Tax=Dietzia sp. 179-F 9C3 NHS TaxID=3374295 RepID=UPI003879A5F7
MTSVVVDDQARALAFYTDVLGFVPGHDVPVGGHLSREVGTGSRLGVRRGSDVSWGGCHATLRRLT